MINLRESQEQTDVHTDGNNVTRICLQIHTSPEHASVHYKKVAVQRGSIAPVRTALKTSASAVQQPVAYMKYNPINANVEDTYNGRTCRYYVANSLACTDVGTLTSELEPKTLELRDHQGLANQNDFKEQMMRTKCFSV